MYRSSILFKSYNLIAKICLTKINQTNICRFASLTSIQGKEFTVGYRIVYRNISNSLTNLSKMVDPKRVISYEDMLNLIRQPEKVIIDVRNPEEIDSTGKIPSSINIPLNTINDALSSMSAEDFKKQFQRDKPSASDELIFYCRSGKRSTEALDAALKLGYSKSKTYLGSWDEWSQKQK